MTKNMRISRTGAIHTAAFILLGVLVLLAGRVQAAGLTIGVSTTPLSTPFYVADKQGFFVQEGLEVVLQDCIGGKACMEQMLAGQTQLATASDLPVMFNSFKHNDFSVITSFSASSRDIKLVAMKSSHVRSVKDLRGKRIALTRGAAAEYFIDLIALTYGIDPKSLTIVDTPADRMEQAAKEHKADVFAGFEPGSFKLMRALKDKAVALDVPTIYTLTFNLTCLKSTAKDRKNDLVKLLRALDRAVRFIQENPGNAQSILMDRFRVDPSFISLNWQDYRFGLSLNQSLLVTLESEARWAIREKIARDGIMPNFLEAIDPEALLKVKPSAVTLVK